MNEATQSIVVWVVTLSLDGLIVLCEVIYFWFSRSIVSPLKQNMAFAEQITQAIQRLDQVIQQNAAGAEEMASTAEELSGQSKQLQGMMAFFTLESSHVAQFLPRQNYTNSQFVQQSIP